MNRTTILATLLFSAILASACDDDVTGPGGIPGIETGVILNSTDISITVFAVDSPSITRTTGLNPAGSPVSLAARGRYVAVPLGLFSSVAVVDLLTDSVSHVPLPANSGATGVDFLNDSIAYVGNSSLNTVSPINVRSGAAGAEIPVSVWPQGIIARGDEVYVLTAQLDTFFVPAAPGRISIIDASTNSVVDSIVLSGLNPAAASFGSDGTLYVINSGTFLGNDGSLSVVNVGTRQETEHHTGFGEFPGDIAFGPGDRVYVSAFAYGVAVWDAAADSFIHPPADPLPIDTLNSSSGVGLDSDGRLYSLVPGDCVSPSQARRLNPDHSLDTSIDTGGCPFGIAFTEVK